MGITPLEKQSSTLGPSLMYEIHLLRQALVGYGLLALQKEEWKPSNKRKSSTGDTGDT